MPQKALLTSALCGEMREMCYLRNGQPLYENGNIYVQRYSSAWQSNVIVMLLTQAVDFQMLLSFRSVLVDDLLQNDKTYLQLTTRWRCDQLIVNMSQFNAPISVNSRIMTSDVDSFQDLSMEIMLSCINDSCRVPVNVVIRLLDVLG